MQLSWYKSGICGVYWCIWVFRRCHLDTQLTWPRRWSRTAWAWGPWG